MVITWKSKRNAKDGTIKCNFLWELFHMLSALEMFGDFHIFVKKMVVVSFFIFQAKWRFKGKIFLAILFYNCFSWGVTANFCSWRMHVSVWVTTTILPIRMVFPSEFISENNWNYFFFPSVYRSNIAAPTMLCSF